MPDVIKSAEQEAVTLWDKVQAWWNNTTVPELKKDELEVIALLQPLLSAAEGYVIQDLIVFVRAVLTTIENPHGTSLADLETALLNSLNKAEGDLVTLAKSLGSNILQALIGLILAKLPK